MLCDVCCPPRPKRVQVMVTEFFPFAHDNCVGPGQRTLSLDKEVPKMDDFVTMLRQLEEAKRLVRAEREAAVARTEDKKTSGSTVDQHAPPEFEAFSRRFREKRAAPKKKKKTVPSDGGEALPLPASSFHTFLPRVNHNDDDSTTVKWCNSIVLY